MQKIFKCAVSLVLAAASCTVLSGCEIYDQIFDPSNGITDPPTINKSFAVAYTEDASTIYKTINYNYRMFYGKYVAQGVLGTEFTNNSRENYLSYSQIIKTEWKEDQEAVLPFRIDAGPNCIDSPINFITGYNWMLLSFLSEDGKVHSIPAAYTVLGNKLTLHPLDDYSYNGYDQTFNYVFTDLIWEYEFSFGAGKMNLKCGDKEITLFAEDFTPNSSGVDLQSARWREGSKKVSEIEDFHIKGDEKELTVVSGGSDKFSYQFQEDGIFKLQWLEGKKMQYAQLAFFYCDDDGLILTDGVDIYDYTARVNPKYQHDVNINVASKDTLKLKKLTEEKKEELTNNIESIFEQLQSQFEANGIQVSLNKETGEVALNSLVLFSKDKAEIAAKGEQLLRNFLTVYTSVIFNGENEKLLSEVVIEGYTDPSGAYDYNMELSERRANAVKDFFLSDQNGLTPDITEKLAPMLTAVGKGSENTIYDANNQIDVDACRRVAFRFLLNVDV